MMKFSDFFKKIAKHFELISKINNFEKEVLDYLRFLKLANLQYEDLPLSKSIFQLKANLKPFKGFLKQKEDYDRKELYNLLTQFSIKETSKDQHLQKLIDLANILVEDLKLILS